MYLDSVTGDVYQKATGAWSVVANIKGDDGASAYEIAVADGFVGTESDWLASLEAPATGQFLFGAGDRINALLVGPKATVMVTFPCTIKSMQLQIVTNDGLPGSIAVDVWKCSYTDASATRPDVSDSITAAATPTISGGSKAQDATLTGWTVACLPGDVLVASVLARSANVSHFALALETEKL